MPSLSDLPTEILGRIAQPLIGARVGFQDDGICNLRLTCRNLCLRTQYEFGRAAFSTLRLDLHPKTLEHLLSVSKQPAFGGAVKKIVFAHWGDECVTFPFIEQDYETQEPSSLEEQVKFVLRSIFGDAFRGLPNLKEIVIITPFVARFQQQESFFDAKVSWDGGEDTNETLEEDRDGMSTFKVNQNCITNDSLYSLLTEAAIKTDTQLTSLEYNDAPPHGISIQHAPAFSVLYGTFAQSVPALRHMQHMKFNICFRKFSWPDASEDKNQVSRHETFGNMFNSMSQLVSLDLKFDGYHKSPTDKTLILEAMNTIDSVRLPHLTTLTIRDTPTTETALAALLLNHKEKLRYLALRNVQIIALGTWRTILALLHNEMPVLDELHLDWLREGSRDIFVRVNFVGRSAVMKGLRGLLENMDMMLG